MDRLTKSEQIADKCELSGCDEKQAKRHHELYVFGNWDVHPPPDFVDWYSKHGPGPNEHGKPANPIPGWNSSGAREEYKRISLGEL